MTRMLAVICTLFVASLVWAGESKEPTRATPDEHSEELERGRLIFRVHCAACHGQSATGGGPIAEVLTVEPPDLTRLAQRAGGRFPAATVRRIVDGREDLLAHGPRQMPVWGIAFQQDGYDTDDAEVATRRIDLVVEYLRSIQVPGRSEDEKTEP